MVPLMVPSQQQGNVQSGSFISEYELSLDIENDMIRSEIRFPLNRQKTTMTKSYSGTKYGIHYYIWFWCHDWPRSVAIVHSELNNK